MDELGGMKPTGRRVPGPAADLVELESEGAKHTAIVFHDEYRDHSSLAEAAGSVLAFIDGGPVPGVADLVDYVPEKGAFIYNTGGTSVWSVYEVVKALGDQGRVAGVRAGLELMYLAAQALEEAEGPASAAGLSCHGNMNPWRILVKANGDVQVVGYGLPQVEIVAFREDESLMPREDSFRYCPPERLEGNPQDTTTDLFGLGLVGFELMIGRPVYDGLVADLRQQAVRAEGSRKLYQVRDQLPEGVRELLGRAIKYDPDSRFPSVNDFIYAVHDILGSPDADGPHLIEMMVKVRGGKQKPKVLMGGQTGTLSKEQLAALREELDEQEAQPLPPPKQARPDPNAPKADAEPQRWARTARRSTEPAAGPPGRASAARPGAPEAPRATSAAPAAAPGRSTSVAPGGDRVLRRGDATDGPRRIRSEAPAPTATAEPAPASRSSAAEALLARLRTSGSGDRPAAPTPMPPAPTPQREPARSMDGLRSSGDKAPEPARPPPVAAKPAEAPSRRAEAPPADAARRPAEELVYFQVSVDGGAPQRTRVKTTEPLAEAANRLVQALGAPPTDLTGQSLGWYRLEQDGKWWRGDFTVAALEADKPVNLARVPNRVLVATFEVEGLPTPMRFQAPVGTAVPVRSLVAHLQRWLRLPEGLWTLVVGGQAAGPMQILEDFEPSEGFTIVVRR